MTRLATLAALAALCLTTATAHAQAPTKPPAANAAFALPSIDTYVSNIYKYYLAYQMLAEERAQRERARQAAKQLK